ncbi:MAG TPA: TorF family putative porin [Chiayiivirga sp.]|nr:TorF family putative porin [Chiayiivirga sp.]
MLTLPRLAAATAMLVMAFPALAQEESDWTLSGGAWLLSDYAWRGVSQSQEDPTWKLEGLVEHASGFYVGGEFYGVDFIPPGEDYDDGISYEGNVYVGWNREFTDSLSLDLSYTRVFYPGSEPDYNQNFGELEAVLGFGGHYSLTANYSDNTVNLGHSAWYWRLDGEWDLGETGFTYGAGLGRYDLGKELGGTYEDYEIFLARSFEHFSAKLAWIDTSGFNETLAENLGEQHLADGRFVLSAGVTF